MPWEREWVPSGFPPGHPLHAGGGFWHDVFRPSPEDYAEEIARAEVIAERLRRATEPDEIADLIARAPRGAFVEGWRQAVAPAWRGLVERGALGPPTHDLLNVRVADWPGRANNLLGGNYFTPRWSETPMTSAWHAPGGGRYRIGLHADTAPANDERRMDAWVESSGTVWAPYIAASQDGGGFHALREDVRGRPLDPNLVIAVPAGASVGARRGGFWHERSFKLLDSVVVTSSHGFGAPFAPQYDLSDAVVAVARGIRQAAGAERLG